jgi:hypothetical protein
MAACLMAAALQTGIATDFGTHLYIGPDAAQDVWALNWVTAHLHQPSQTFEGSQYFPSRFSVLYCDPLLGPAVLVAPLRLLGANPIALYNAACVLVFALTGYASYRLALRLWGSWPAALLAAVLIAQAPPFLAHRGHLNLVTIGGLPLVILGLLNLFEKPRLPVAVLTGLALGLQAATSGYYALIGAALAALLCAIRWRDAVRPRTASCVAAVALVAAVVVAPYVYGFLHLGREETSVDRELSEVQHYSVDVPHSFLRTQSVLWQHVLGSAYEEPMWPGLALPILALIGLRRPWDANVKLLAIVGAAFFVLALGPELTLFGRRTIPLPFAALRALPFVGTVKHPNTFMVPVWIVGGLLAARGLTRLRLPPPATFAILAFAALETTNAWPRREPRPLEAPPEYHLLDGEPAGAMLELPSDIEPDRYAQWASIFHGRPTVNGNGAFCPESYNRLFRVIRKEWDVKEPAPQQRSEAFSYLLSRYPIRYVLARRGTPGHIVRNLDATPAAFELLREAADGARLYRVHNGGRGRALRRWLRADQLRGPVAATLRGAPGARFRLTLHAHDERAAVLDERALTGAVETLTWRVPPERVAVGMNNLELSVDRGELELTELRWDEPARGAGATRARP